jgi:hypothetical protein
MYTIHLYTLGKISEFQFDMVISGVEQKTKSRLECRHRKLGKKTKKALSLVGRGLSF